MRDGIAGVAQRSRRPGGQVPGARSSQRRVVTGDRPVERAVNAATCGQTGAGGGRRRRENSCGERDLFIRRAQRVLVPWALVGGGKVLDVRLPTTIAVIGRGWETTIGIHSEAIQTYSDTHTEPPSQTASRPLQRHWSQVVYAQSDDALTRTSLGQPRRGPRGFSASATKAQVLPRQVSDRETMFPEGRSGENKDPRDRRNSARETRQRIYRGRCTEAAHRTKSVVDENKITLTDRG